jgi:hypothetical protein
MERFFSKIEKTTSCWIWKGAIRGKNGYGCMKVDGKVVDVHRFSYAFHNGPIPAGMLVCHSCDNRLCVNPAHLFLGTHTDNMQDCKSKGRLHFRDNAHLKRHPSTNSYKKGCRCDGCREVEARRRQNQRARGIKT